MLGLALSLRADSHHTSRQISVSSPEGRHRRRTAAAEAAKHSGELSWIAGIASGGSSSSSYGGGGGGQKLGRAILDGRHRIMGVATVVAAAETGAAQLSTICLRGRAGMHGTPRRPRDLSTSQQ